MADLWSICGPTRFYFGASYGSAQTALRRTEEPHVILSYVTANNRPWDSIEDLFIDCGAYSVFKREGGYTDSAEDYAEWIAERPVDKYALRDIPVDEKTLGITGESVQTHQRRTVEMHAECLAHHQDLGIDAKPVTAVQGETPEDYVRHLDQHNEQGTLMFDVGIGSLANRPITEQEEIVTAVSEALDPRVSLHGFGIGGRSFASSRIRNVLDSADSTGWSYGLYGERINFDERMYHVALMQYLEEKRLLYARFGQDDIEWYGDEEDRVNMDLCEEILDEQPDPFPERGFGSPVAVADGGAEAEGDGAAQGRLDEFGG